MLFSVDLATIDPTSEETEQETSAVVGSLVQAYTTGNRKLELTGSGSSKEVDKEKNKEQWPVLAMFRNLEYLPGPLRQFWILYR